MVAIWSACLTTCKYPFPLKSVHFEFLTISLIFILVANFYIGGYFCVKFQKDPLYGLNLTFFAPWLPWQQPPFWICSTPKSCHTLRGYCYSVLWNLMKGIPIFLNPSFFVSMTIAEKFVQPIPICFCLSSSTRCGCCSLQVSSISIRRVTCYDHFCVFQFFSILAVSMATAVILKIPKVVWTSTDSA